MLLSVWRKISTHSPILQYVIPRRWFDGPHDDVIKWKHFPRNWPFVRGIHRSPVNSPHKGQWRGALMFSFICVWINDWVNNGEAGDLRRYRIHYDVTVMGSWNGKRCLTSTVGLLSWYPSSLSSHFNVLEDRMPIGGIHGYLIFTWWRHQMVTFSA